VWRAPHCSSLTSQPHVLWVDSFADAPFTRCSRDVSPVRLDTTTVPTRPIRGSHLLDSLSGDVTTGPRRLVALRFEQLALGEPRSSSAGCIFDVTDKHHVADPAPVGDIVFDGAFRNCFSMNRRSGVSLPPSLARSDRRDILRLIPQRSVSAISSPTPLCLLH